MAKTRGDVMKRETVLIVVTFVIASAICVPLSFMGCSLITDPSFEFACPNYARTNIDPLTGVYVINSRYSFVVTEEGGRKEIFLVPGVANLTAGSHYIDRGAFRLQWGEVDGTHCPTDGYCLSGMFDAEDSASGTLSLMYDCEVVGTIQWTTN